MEEIILNYEYYNEKKNINHFDNYLYNENFDKIGNFELNNNILKVNWDNQLEEIFNSEGENSNNFKFKKKNNFKKIRISKDKWIDDVILFDNGSCQRKSIIYKGKYEYNNEKLLIEWENYERDTLKYDLKKKIYSIDNFNTFSNIEVKLYNYINDDIYIDNYTLNINKILKNNMIVGKIIKNSNLINIKWNNSSLKYYKFINNNTLLLDINLFDNPKYILNIDNNIYYFFNDILINKYNEKIYNLNSKENNLYVFIDDEINYLFIKKINNKYNFCNYLYIKEYYFENYNWKDNLLLNYYSGEFHRISNKNEKGYFIENNNKINIKWENWDEEVYILDEEIYKLELFFLKEYRFIHKDWDEICKIDKNKIYRKNGQSANININSNNIQIDWDKWGKNLFYKILDVYYLDEILNNYLINIYLKDDKYFLLNDKRIILDKNYNNIGNYIEQLDKYELKISNNIEYYYKHFFNEKFILHKEEYIRIKLNSYNKYYFYIKDDILYDNELKSLSNYEIKDNEIIYENEKFLLNKNYEYYSETINNKKLIIINNDIKYYNINYNNNYIYDANENCYNFIRTKDLFYVDEKGEIFIYKLFDKINNIYIKEEDFNKKFNNNFDIEYFYFFNDTLSKEECILYHINNLIQIYSYESLIKDYLILDSKEIIDNYVKNDNNIFSIYSIKLYNKNLENNIIINEDYYIEYYEDNNYNNILLKKNLFNDKYIKQEIIDDIKDNILKEWIKYKDINLIVCVEINNIKQIDNCISFIKNNVDFDQKILVFINFEYDFGDNFEIIFRKFNNISIYENNNNYYLSLYLLNKYIELNDIKEKDILYLNNFKEKYIEILDFKKLELDNYRKLNLIDFINNKYDLIIYLIIWIILNNTHYNKFYNNILLNYNELNKLLFKIDRYYT